jgi:dipeptidyl aminopeptidase/acylaminoacyl peptidase
VCANRDARPKSAIDEVLRRLRKPSPSRKRYARQAATLTVAISLVIAMGAVAGFGQKSPRTFTLADDIGLSWFGDPYTTGVDAITASPDGNLFAVVIERGRLDTNRVESTLRVFSVKAIREFLAAPTVPDLAVSLTLTESTYKQSPIISHLRWLPDSSGVAFLRKTASGRDQLVLADIRAKTVSPLTSEEESVAAYDIRGPDSYVYSVQSPAIRERITADAQATSVTGTGRSLHSLVFAVDDEYSSVFKLDDLSELWAVVDGTRLQVRDRSRDRPVLLYRDGQDALSLSPDRHSVVTAQALKVIPVDWEALYPPPASSSAYRIRAGEQDLDSTDGGRDVSEYVLIDLVGGEVKPLTNAPLGGAAGWWNATSASWSPNGRLIALSNTFLPAPAGASPEHVKAPCSVLIDLHFGSSTCLELLRGTENNNHYVENIGFSPDSAFVSVNFQSDGALKSNIYKRGEDGAWYSVPSDTASKTDTLRLRVDEGLNRPPVLIATDEATGKSRIIWDPNPHLRGVDLTQVSVLEWRDKTGRHWIGGLYKPPNYLPGRRYPLVIQTHGFHENEFRPSGAFPTAFAAQELAAAGIMVLQLRDCPVRLTPEEGPCNVEGYESAVQQLDSDGLIDPNNVGIIGFSRSCYYVMKALTESKVEFKAASITDGVTEGYVQYMTSVDAGANAVSHEADAMIGSSPFGQGLQQWLKESPEFNMHKVTTPLQVVALGHFSLLFMWEPYAALRYLNKPVDLMLLNTGEHVLTNPQARMSSQGSTLDWFRFWLQHEEDPDPAKREQYARWRRLRELRTAK